MSGREKPDAPGLWRDANEKTVVACMESGELAIRDADTGEILSAGQLEQAAPFQRTEWKGIDLTRAGFSAMPDTAGCWSDANGTLWLIDMAPAERSTFYEQAVPKGKRRPMMENWIPELGGKH